MAGGGGGEVISRGKIFISYRRDDDPGFAQALYLRLEQEFGGENLFMDVEGHIKPGSRTALSGSGDNTLKLWDLPYLPAAR